MYEWKVVRNPFPLDGMRWIVQVTNPWNPAFMPPSRYCRTRIGAQVSCWLHNIAEAFQ